MQKNRAIIAIGAGLLASCLTTTAPDGQLKCALSGRACPSGYYCAADKACWHNGHTPSGQPNCSDGIKDGNETDVDCGGSCPPCAPGKSCNAATDCTTLDCQMNVCITPPSHCTNGIKDADETDVDCGGMDCMACATGKMCLRNLDCLTAICDSTNHVCIDSCHDGIKDGDETDVDCGGSCPTKCAATQGCGAPMDCGSNQCVGGFCVPVPLPAWTKVLDYSTTGAARTAACGAAGVDGKIYVYGGTDIENTAAAPYQAFEVYDPTTNTLVGAGLSGTSPVPLGAAGCSMVATSDGKLWVLGGVNSTWGTTPTAPVQVYDPSTQSWDTSTYPSVPYPSGEMGAPLALGTAQLVGNAVFAFSGFRAGQPYSYDVVEALDIAPKTWRTPAPNRSPNARRWQASAVGTDGKIYVFGGWAAGGPTNLVLSYDPVANLWSSNSGPSAPKTMTTAREELGGALGADGLIYAIGGSTAATGNAISYTAANAVQTVEGYAPKSNVWITGPNLNAPGAFIVAATAKDGRIYSIGGANGTTDTPATNYRRVVEAYGPVVTFANTSGAADSKRSVSGSNFAPNATVNVYFGSAPLASPTASGTSDGTGALTTPIVFTVPAVSPGTYPIKVMDTRSSYPYYATFTVQ